MPDPQLPANVNFIFVRAPLLPKALKEILDSIESTADVNAVDELYPTNSYVTHVYAATNKETNEKGYAILYGRPPTGGIANPIQAAPVDGADDTAKADNASLLIGRGNELIGYEDFAGPQRVVIFRDSPPAVAAPTVPGRLSWESADHPERRDWSTRLIALAGQNKAQLDQGGPNAFIAGYNGLSGPLQIKFWAEMLVAVAKFESAWKPNDVYHESFGVNSVGLLQLSLQDQNTTAYQLTPHISSEEALKDPLLNIQWGVTIFAYWLARDGVVASGSGNSSKGSARYWSVMRAGHKVELIKALTKTNVGL